jgi:catechol 2,3-dioxygenase-like lactoylglutathione lyase family enzyme
MIDHTGVVVSEFEISKKFYTAALGAIGLTLLKEFPASVTGGIDVAGFGAAESAAQASVRSSGWRTARRARLLCTSPSASQTAPWSIPSTKRR